MTDERIYEVFLGDGAQSRPLFSSEDQFEAIAFAKDQAFRHGGKRVTVIYRKPMGTHGRSVPQMVWDSLKVKPAEPGYRERERMVEAARARRKVLGLF